MTRPSFPEPTSNGQHSRLLEFGLPPSRKSVPLLLSSIGDSFGLASLVTFMVPFESRCPDLPFGTILSSTTLSPRLNQKACLKGRKMVASYRSQHMLDGMEDDSRKLNDACSIDNGERHLQLTTIDWAITLTKDPCHCQASDPLFLIANCFPLPNTYYGLLLTNPARGVFVRRCCYFGGVWLVVRTTTVG